MLSCVFLLQSIPITPSVVDIDQSEHVRSIAELKQRTRYIELQELILVQSIVPEDYWSFFTDWNYDYPKSILVGIIQVETNWINVRSGSQNNDGSVDLGLAQLNSAYIDYFVRKYWDKNADFDTFNGLHSLHIAAEHIQWLYNETLSFENTIRAYNIGIGSVRNGWRQRSGNLYLRKVLEALDI